MDVLSLVIVSCHGCLVSCADLHYAKLRRYLEQRGTPIGTNDMLIAAHALSLICTVITANEREFSHVPGLKVENWLDG